MRLKITPRVDARYWTAILVASMCGTNLGDFFPDVLKLSAPIGLLIQFLIFVAIVLADRMTQKGSEAFYWLAILTVRAAATNIADFSIASAHLTYIEVAAALGILLAVLMIGHQTMGPKPTTGELPPTTAFYWFTMLTAGALGTIIGDGLGHAFGAVQLGVPVSAGLATVALAAILGVRVRMALVSAWSYWLAVVAVRWWGTNVGDILAFVLSLTVSMVVTGVVMLLILLVWRPRPIDQFGLAAG